MLNEDELFVHTFFRLFIHSSFFHFLFSIISTFILVFFSQSPFAPALVQNGFFFYFVLQLFNSLYNFSMNRPIMCFLWIKNSHYAHTLMCFDIENITHRKYIKQKYKKQQSAPKSKLVTNSILFFWIFSMSLNETKGKSLIDKYENDISLCSFQMQRRRKKNRNRNCGKLFKNFSWFFSPNELAEGNKKRKKNNRLIWRRTNTINWMFKTKVFTFIVFKYIIIVWPLCLEIVVCVHCTVWNLNL